MSTPFSTVHKDLCLSAESVIAHQCNCLTSTAKGVAKDLFSKFPYSNVYTSEFSSKRIPGKIIVSTSPSPRNPIIVGLCGQNYPGDPKDYETSATRERWFSECLELLGKFMTKNKLSSVAFSYKIGCGYARGNWVKYEAMLKDFQREYGVVVKLYKQ